MGSTREQMRPRTTTSWGNSVPMSPHSKRPKRYLTALTLRPVTLRLAFPGSVVVSQPPLRIDAQAGVVLFL